MRLFSHKNRPVHLGPYPLERLTRCSELPAHDGACESVGLTIENPSKPQSIANAMRPYINIMDRLRDGPVAPKRAPIPDDPLERSNHLKAACYFLNASMAATCRISGASILDVPIINNSLSEVTEQEYLAGSVDNVMANISAREGAEVWQRVQETERDPFDHTYALVILVEYTREPDPDELSENWIAGTQALRAAARAAEIAGMISTYVRLLGYKGRSHTATASELNADQLVLASGLGEINRSNGSSKVTNPYLDDGFGVAIVSTTMELAVDQPLAPGAGAKARNFKWWLGVSGTQPGFQGRPFKGRSFHLGPQPMEKLKRVNEPTTLVDTPNIPRIPKRHDMFIRAGIGDLGKKAQKNLLDFFMITKSPLGHSTIPLLGGMVPLQYGQEADRIAPGTDDPKKNAEAIKAALYYLGADMVGICEIPEHAWYSHDMDGTEIKPYHKYAISILVDQGYETMEGASGDDWISGMQSMRAYMRVQLIGGIVGTHIRNLGYPARGHSVMDQDVLHIPLILLSGLGEMGRIGELVLNPFVGPRFKSGIITTNMPLEPDKPIDFGLQDFCEKCVKCARECPCTAIPFSDKIMFNNYEIWKTDVEKCARYRITTAGGSMCGRCMKTCPWNMEGVLKEGPFLWAAMHLPFTRKWIAKLDDKVGNGRINPVKRWWWDLDTDEEGNIIKAKKSNKRQLSFRPSLSFEKQKLACYPFDRTVVPAGGASVPDRKEAVQRYKQAEKSVDYRARMERGETGPAPSPEWLESFIPPE